MFPQKWEEGSERGAERPRDLEETLHFRWLHLCSKGAAKRGSSGGLRRMQKG